jgi:hypothetical protein
MAGEGGERRECRYVMLLISFRNYSLSALTEIECESNRRIIG